MQTSTDFTFASPLDGFLQKYVPREHEKVLRNSIIQAVALISVSIIILGLYYVYSILEPFCVPLFWALLTGLVLHPYKRSTTNSLRMSLESLTRSKQTMVLAFGLTTLDMVDQLLETVGTFITKRWKLLLSAITIFPSTYLVYYLWPSALEVSLVILQNILLVDFSQFLSTVSLHHVVSSAVVCIVSIIFGRPEYKFLYQTSSLVTWVLLGSYLMNFLWPPLVQLLVVLWLYGYCTLVDQGDEADGTEDSRIRSAILSFLHRINLLPFEVTEGDNNKSTEDENLPPSSSTPLPGKGVEALKDDGKVGPLESTPKVSVGTLESTPKLKIGPLESTPQVKVGPLESTPKVKGLPLESTPNVPVIQHPGVSALKKEHGVLKGSRERPNISGIEKVIQSGGRVVNTPRSGLVGGNTPWSRILGRSYLRVKRRTSSLTELHSMQSMTYIYWALWACAVIQLWLRPSLINLLPVPLAYHLLKRLAVSTGLSSLLSQQVGLVWALVEDWARKRQNLLLPPPLAVVLRVSFRLERKILACIITHSDSIVTALMILTMVLGITFTSIFMFFQVYSETVYLVQGVGNIASSLNMNDSYLLSQLNHSLADNGYDSMENVVEQVHNYGRAWISSTLQQSLAETEPEVRSDLESKVLELWDRSYQYWVLAEQDKQTAPMHGPTVTGEAISSSLGEVFQKIYSSPNILNMASVQTFVQNNMGTLTSIMEQVWTLFKGNIGFLSDSVLGIVRIVLHGGSGVVNFVFGIVIYLTALFYLLSNSGGSYIPMEVVSQYSVFQMSEVGSSLQKAVNSVFLITVKMSSFYFLWTYLTHVIFQASIVVLPLLFSSFIAACPFTGQQVVALPAALELWLLQERPVAAVLLVVMQVAPSWLVDAAIYSEIKGGIHPWFTGLAVVGGVYMFGVLGAIYGPLALCVLYVAINVYSTFMTETEPDTPDIRQQATTLRTPLIRSGTII